MTELVFWTLSCWLRGNHLIFLIFWVEVIWFSWVSDSISTRLQTSIVLQNSWKAYFSHGGTAGSNLILFYSKWVNDSRLEYFIYFSPVNHWFLLFPFSLVISNIQNSFMFRISFRGKAWACKYPEMMRERNHGVSHSGWWDDSLDDSFVPSYLLWN